MSENSLTLTQPRLLIYRFLKHCLLWIFFLPCSFSFQGMEDRPRVGLQGPLYTGNYYNSDYVAWARLHGQVSR